MSKFKEYYASRDITAYSGENYYREMTIVINQIRRVQIMKKFFKKYLKPNSKILDLACGNATDIIHLNKLYGKSIEKWVGVDLGKKTIEQLNEKNMPKCSFVQGDVENINLNEKFDIVLSLEVAEHLENFPGHLESIKKHMKQNSVLILSTPNRKYLFKDMYAILSKLTGKINTIESVNEIDSLNQHINVMSYKELKNHLEKHGFKVIEKERTMLMFGARYADPFYGALSFADQLLPKKIPYLGNGIVLVAKLKQ